MNEEYIYENPEYIDILKKIIQHEENLDPEEFEDRYSLENFNDENDTEHDVIWRNTDISAHSSKLYQLEVNGFLDRVVDTSSTTMYSMSDHRDEVEELVDGIDKEFGTDGIVEMHEFPDEEELEEMGVFDRVVGYEDVKFLLRRAMSRDGIVNVVLFGGPGSAKTVFLRCINELNDSIYISGSPTSGAGFFDVMFEEKPRYVSIDELDNMEKDDQKALADYTSEGILVETKGNDKRRKMKTNTHTFAAANRPDDLLPEIEDRFIDLHFEPYSKDEFFEVCENVLDIEEGKSEEESRKIANAVWDMEGMGDVRKAIQVARLSDGDPEKIIEVVDEYSSARPGLR